MRWFRQTPDEAKKSTRDTTHCTSCGSPIPSGQGKSCSMCYGDVDHGRDGYYRAWLEQDDRRDDDRR